MIYNNVNFDSILYNLDILIIIQICMLRFFGLILFLLHFSVNAEIKLGVSNATSGPTKELGQDLNWGAELYFNEVNRKGGINGEKISLLKLDDGYEPDRTVHNTKELLSKKVMGLFNFVGTPTTSAIINILTRQKTPLITPFTGADFLRVHPNKVFNLRASYEQEAYAQVNLLVGELGIKKIALFIQADEFGLALERYQLKAMREKGIKPVKVVRYKRNTEDVKKAADYLVKKDIEAILYVGTFRPLLSFMEYTQGKSFNPIYVTSSFVSSYRLFERIDTNKRVIVTEVVPDPNHCELKSCRLFRHLASFTEVKDYNRVHFEGFLNAMYVVNALRDCAVENSEIERACFTKHLRRLQSKSDISQNSPQGYEGKIYFSEFSM